MATFLEEESSDLGNKRLTKKSVSFVDDDIVKPKPPSRLDIMKSELERMRRRDEEIDRREKEHRRLVNEITVKPVQNGYSKIDKTKILMINSSLVKVKTIPLQYF